MPTEPIDGPAKDYRFFKTEPSVYRDSLGRELTPEDIEEGRFHDTDTTYRDRLGRPISKDDYFDAVRFFETQSGDYRDPLGRPLEYAEYKESPGSSSGDRITYNSYAGTDIAATILLPEEGPVHLGDIHTISYSIHRENTPVRYIGHSNVCGWVKGPRTIAGSMVFTQFNEYTWYRLERFKAMKGKNMYPLADMLPPFDVVLSFANETGSFSKMKILGITIVDEGAAMSVDDLMIETDYTFMAQAIQPITNYTPEGFSSIRDWKAGGVSKTVPTNNKLGIGYR